MVFFHPFRRAENLTMAIAVNAYGKQNGDILNLATPTALR